MSNWARRALAALAVTAALVAGTTATPAEAATLTIGSVAKTDAADIKSKGTLRTPAVKTTGNVAVASRSYVISKGKKVVAKTTTQNKTYKLAYGSYTVKSTTKYRTFTTKTLKTGGWVGEFPDQEMTTCRATDDLSHPEDPSAQEGDPTVYFELLVECKDSRGALWSGGAWGYISKDEESALKAEFPKGKWGSPTSERVPSVSFYVSSKWVPDVQRVYGPTKIVTKSQRVTIGNAPTMTLYEYKKIKSKMKLAKVKSIVGGTGKVVDRWSWGKDDYVVRVFNGHAISFVNGKVDSKYWTWS